MSGIEQKSKAFKIISYPRIHITLVGMNDGGYRINGGIGFSVSTPMITSHFEESDIIQIIDKREIKFTNKEIARLHNLLTEIIDRFKFDKKLKCTIEGNALPHYGLGSNTAIYMSCVEAIFIYNGFKYNHDDIIISSKRGGTSGVGINTYFDGGFVFDVGIRSNNEKIIPSSIAIRKGKKPLVLFKGKLPNWEIGLCIPKYILNKSENEEIEFFKTNCPIDKRAVENILYETVYGITASLIEKDYEVFCKAVNTIQTTKWKSLERSLYGINLLELEQKIKSFGADCVGMSSLGPILFFLGKDINSIVKNIYNEIIDITCINTSFNNRGRIICYD